jgi:2-pyrone-4,6-dicarboxylate lactonase
MTKSCMAPDPNPVKPKYAPPPGACDAHCHVFGPGNRFPYAADTTYIPPDAPAARLYALHAHLGLSRAVIVQASCHGTDNRAMLDAIAGSEGRYRGVAMVGAGTSDRELQTLHDGGIRGIRFNFVANLGGAPDLELFDEMIDRIGAFGWHVVLHLDAEDILTYADRIKRMKVPFVIDHMGRVKAGGGVGQKPFQALLELMRNDLAWVKVTGAERCSTAGRPFHDSIPLAAALIEAAPDRILWGTDWPHPNIARDMPNDGELVDLFARFTADEALRRKILVDNPARLYWA